MSAPSPTAASSGAGAVKANRAKAGGRIDGYLTIGCMRNALLTSRGVYNTLVASL